MLAWNRECHEGTRESQMFSVEYLDNDTHEQNLLPRQPQKHFQNEAQNARQLFEFKFDYLQTCIPCYKAQLNEAM